MMLPTTGFLRVLSLILSLSQPLHALTLSAERETSTTKFERSTEAGVTSRIRLQNPDRSALSKEAISKIKVFHQHMNLTASHENLQKRTAPRQITYCGPYPGTLRFGSSYCDIHRGPRHYTVACNQKQKHREAIVFHDGQCSPTEICVDNRLNPLLQVAYCVSQENFVQLALTSSDFHSSPMPAVPAGYQRQLQLRVTNPGNTLWEKQYFIELDTEKCVKNNMADCGTMRTKSCEDCNGLTLAPVDSDANLYISTVSIKEPGVNVWLSTLYSKL